MPNNEKALILIRDCLDDLFELDRGKMSIAQKRWHTNVIHLLGKEIARLRRSPLRSTYKDLINALKKSTRVLLEIRDDRNRLTNNVKQANALLKSITGVLGLINR